MGQLTSEHYYMQSSLNSIGDKMCFVTLLESDLLFQYVRTKTFIRGAFYHILKVVDDC